MKSWSLCLATLALVGCGADNAASVFEVASDNSLVAKTIPAIRKACPGLDKYASQFERARVENNYRTAVVFDIPESARIPDPYKAYGHTCSIEIESDASSIFIEKAACKSVCLDQEKVPDGQLKLPL